MDTVSETLRKRLAEAIESGVTIYSIAKATGLHQSVLKRFVANERKQIRSETIDKLAEYFNLRLTPARRRRR